MPLPPGLVALDPVGEITAIDRRPAGRRRAFDPTGEITVTDRRVGGADGPRRGAGAGATGRVRVDGDRDSSESRAATRAAAAEEFAARFGLEAPGPSAAALADRYGFRYEAAGNDPTLPAGRRTVTITGRGAERSVPPAERALSRSMHGGRHIGSRVGGSRLRAVDGFHGDRTALWAVAIALLLAVAAAVSAHVSAGSSLLPH